MTQKEAIIKALEELGGRAQLSDLYSRVIQLGDFKEGSDKKATIRALLQRTPECFRPTPNKKGWWELVSYQEEIAKLRQTIADLKDKLEVKDKDIECLKEELKEVKTEEDFIKRLLKETKKIFKHNKDKADVVRLILDKMGCTDAEAELDAWMEGKEKPTISVNGDFVMNKNQQFKE